MNEKVSVDGVWLAWLEYFYCSADFGPADGDVRRNIYENFKAQTGYTVPEMEEE